MIVLGAGLVGTVLSVHLAKAGFEVEVYDSRPDPRQIEPKFDRSINITLCERGFRALESIGMNEVILKMCVPLYGRVIHNLEGDLSYQQYGNNEEALYAIRRHDLIQVLLEHADKYENVNFHFNQKCVNVDLDAVTLDLQDRETGKVSQKQTRHIFGTDGARSVIRNEMQQQKRFNYSQTYWSHGYKEAILPATNHNEWPLKENALHIWPRNGFMLIAFPNLDHSFTVTLHLPYEGEISYSSLSTVDDYNTFFKAHFPDIMPLMAPHLASYVNNPIESLVTIKSFPWTYKDSFVLLGDACHAIYPFYGQGANAGFEDSQILMNYLQKYPEDRLAAFQAYEKHRKPDTDAIADLSMEHFSVLAKSVSDPKFQLRKKIERKLEYLFPGYAALYNNISFTSMPYNEAWRIEDANQEIIKKLLAVEGIEGKLEQPEINEFIVSLVNKMLADGILHPTLSKLFVNGNV